MKNQQDSCKSCKYFRKKIDLNNIASTSGSCCRRPPSCQFFPTAQGQVANISGWPTADEKDWCGEFDKIEKPVAAVIE